jgi:hypothetical protein
MPFAEETGGAVLLRLKVSPGAAKQKILGPYGDRLKLAVRSPPEKGKANKEIVAMLAKALGVTKKQIAIVAGDTSSEKTVRIEGVAVGEVLGLGGMRR